MSRVGEPALWVIFGEYADGCVDVSDGDRDVLVHVTREVADAAIAAQQAVWEAWLATPSPTTDATSPPPEPPPASPKAPPPCDE